MSRTRNDPALSKNRPGSFKKMKKRSDKNEQKLRSKTVVIKEQIKTQKAKNFPK